MIYVYLIQTHNTLDNFRWMLVLASHLFTFGIVFFCKGYESAFIFIVNVAFKVAYRQSMLCGGWGDRWTNIDVR